MTELEAFALGKQSSLSAAVCQTAFTAMSHEAAQWDSGFTELAAQQPQILHNILAIIRLLGKEARLSSEGARALCVVGLAMHRHSDTSFGEVAKQFFSSGNQLDTLQKHNELCAVLGLCGLLRALESDGLLDSVQESELQPVLDLLCAYVAKNDTLSAVPSDAFSGVDITRCVVETAYACYQMLHKRNIIVETFSQILVYILRRGISPGVTPTAIMLLEQPAGDEIREQCVGCIAENEPGASEMETALLSVAFYEAVRLENTPQWVLNNNILLLTQHLEVTQANEEQQAHDVIHALLRRLLDAGLFYQLLALMSRNRGMGNLKRWWGMETGEVVQFWGEHIILWCRMILLESESNEVAKKLQEMFESKEEIKDRDGDILEDAMELRTNLWQKISRLHFVYRCPHQLNPGFM